MEDIRFEDIGFEKDDEFEDEELHRYFDTMSNELKSLKDFDPEIEEEVEQMIDEF